MPKISIVLPLYNATDFIEHCFKMLYEQTFSDYEIIAIDDGSTDDTWKKLQKIADADNRIQAFTQKNAGPGVTRNVGFTKTTSPYVIFLDPDDCFDIDFLKLMYEASQANDTDIVICNSTLYDLKSGKASFEDWTLPDSLSPHDTVFSGADVADNVFRFSLGWPWDKLYRRSFLVENNLVFPNLRNSEDGVMVFSSFCEANRIYIIRKPLIQHTMNRNGSVSCTRSENKLCFFEAIQLIRKNLESKNIFSQYERAYLNWSLDYCIWNLNSASPSDQQDIFSFIKKTGFIKLGIFEHSADYYYDQGEYHTAELMMKYHFPECAIIAGKDAELQSIFNSTAYHIGAALAQPKRCLHDRKEVKAQKKFTSLNFS